MAIPSPKQQYIPDRDNARKAVLVLALLFASFFLSDLVAQQSWHAAARWSLIALVSLFSAMCIMGLAVLSHEAVHRCLFSNAFCNEAAGGILAGLSLIPLYANRQLHLTHHRYAHQPGLDPENEMHERPFWIAFLFGSQIALLIQYRLVACNLLFRMTDRRFALRNLKDLLFLSIAAGVYLFGVPSLGLSLSHTVLPSLGVLPLVFSFRGMLDHYGVPAVTRTPGGRVDVLEEDGTRWRQRVAETAPQVTGWVVITHPLLQWLWSNVNYHEVHHKYPYLSHCHLAEAFRETRNRHPYLVAHGYARALMEIRARPYYFQAAVDQYPTRRPPT